VKVIQSILQKKDFDEADIVTLLAATHPNDVEAVRRRAESELLKHCGRNVHFRGLVEFSNVCERNCYYCGIRRGNLKVDRYNLSREGILTLAKDCAERGFGSLVLQSGERRDSVFIALVEDVVRTIKKHTRNASLPNGLGITLCVGEQSEETYRRFFAAGAHRYLLRIETSSPQLFKKLHPPGQTFSRRLSCLKTLKEIGYQVGSGILIGVPGQTPRDLARDVLFLRDQDVDMIGMGPYVVHRRTPVGRRYPPLTANRRKEIMRVSLLMIAVVRIVLKNVNIAATTALQSLDSWGRERGVQFGANVIMPQMTPPDVRNQYLLYQNKPVVDEYADDFKSAFEKRLRPLNREIALNRWGDSPHYFVRDGHKS